MQNVGSILRSLREERGLTLEYIEQQTKVRKKYLQAIEEGNVKTLPAQVYVVGFVRSYLQVLEFKNTEEIIAMVKEYYDSSKPETDKQAETLVSSVDLKTVSKNKSEPLPKREIKTREKNFGARYIWIILIVVILAAAAFLYFIGSREKPADPNDIITPPPIVDPVEPIEPTDPTIPVVPEPSEPEFTGVKVKITAIDGACWTAVTVDGEYKEETLRAGDVREYTAETSIKIKFGNAGGVKCEYNGEVLDPVGTKGQVLTKEFFPPEKN